MKLAISSEQNYTEPTGIFNWIDRIKSFETKKEPLRHFASEKFWDSLKGKEHSIKVYTGVLEQELYFGEPLGSTLQNAIPFHYFWGAYFELRPKRDLWTSRTYTFLQEDEQGNLTFLRGCISTTWSMHVQRGLPVMGRTEFIGAVTVKPDRHHVFPQSSFASYMGDDAVLKIDGQEHDFDHFIFGFRHPMTYGIDFVPEGSQDYTFNGRLIGGAPIQGAHDVYFTIRESTGKGLDFDFRAEFNRDGSYTGIVNPPGEKDLVVLAKPPF